MNHHTLYVLGGAIARSLGGGVYVAFYTEATRVTTKFHGASFILLCEECMHVIV